MPRLFAFYLPQYYPTKENNAWWGPGFTEWTNVSLARPLFKGHFQPQIPGELGFYDLRLEQTRIDQAKLAAEHGIEGFIYWHYWLDDHTRMLNLPYDQLMESGHPEFPFCLAWANHSWKGVFFGSNKVLVEQKYGGDDDYTKHFYFVLNAFKDKRYAKVGNKPIFYIFSPKLIPDCKHFTELWNSLAKKEGFIDGLHFIGEGIDLPNKEKYGLDAVSYTNHRKIASYNVLNIKNKYLRYATWKLIKKRGLQVYEYADALKYFLNDKVTPENVYPSIVPNWDTTPRLGKNAVILNNSTPELFGKHVAQVLDSVKHKDAGNNIVFIKSWNEWAEGNYLEPSWKWGRAYLETLKTELEKHNEDKKYNEPIL